MFDIFFDLVIISTDTNMHNEYVESEACGYLVLTTECCFTFLFQSFVEGFKIQLCAISAMRSTQ